MEEPGFYFWSAPWGDVGQLCQEVTPSSQPIRQVGCQFRLVMRQISSLKQLWGMRACLDVFLSYCIFKPGDKVLSWASTRSISVGPGLLLQRSRVRFTQGSFPWLNCLCSEPGLLFHSFCGKLSKSNWGKLSISASSRSQMFAAHSGMEVRVKTNTNKTQEQAPNYFNLSEMTPSAEKKYSAWKTEN